MLAGLAARGRSIAPMKCSSSTGGGCRGCRRGGGGSRSARRRAVERGQHAGHDVVDVGEVAAHAPSLNTSIGRPARIARENRIGAMSGRPQGPYTVKKRSAVHGSGTVRVAVRHQLVRALVAA
jgi:hypothetical protein